MITVTELNKIKESLLNGMKENFKQEGSLEPITILVGQDGEMAIISTPYTNQTEKRLMIGGVKQMCKQMNPAAIAMINEAWMATIPKGSKSDQEKFQKELKESGKSVKDISGRKECAVMIFETAYSHEMIIRDIDKVNNDLINEMRTNKVESIFCNMLAPVSKN
jgi:hypothetical protein